MFSGGSLSPEVYKPRHQFPYVSTGHYPSNPAPYGCKLTLEEERCNTQDRYALEDCLRQKDSASKSSQKQGNNSPRQASQGPSCAGRVSLCKFICCVYMSYNILASVGITITRCFPWLNHSTHIKLLAVPHKFIRIYRLLVTSL